MGLMSNDIKTIQETNTSEFISKSSTLKGSLTQIIFKLYGNEEHVDHVQLTSVSLCHLLYQVLPMSVWGIPNTVFRKLGLHLQCMGRCRN